MTDDAAASSHGDPLMHAVAQVAQGDHAAAERNLRGILAEAPGNADALHDLAAVLLGQGRVREATPLIRRAVDANPDNPKYLRLLAVTQIQSHNTRRAMQTLDRLIELAPDDADGRYLLAVQHRNRGNVAEAMAHLGEVLRCRPDHVAALIDSGGLFARQGRLDEARSAFVHVTRIAPDNADAWANLGNVHLLQGAFSEAIQAFEKSLAFNEAHTEASLGLVIALRRRGMPEDSAERAEILLDSSPENARLHNLRGTALRECGRFAEARRSYQEAVARDANQSSARLNLAMLDLLEGDWRPGWQGYELRWQEPAYAAARRNFAQPAWNGETMSGRTLLLYTEQGIGDALQFARFVPDVAERSGAEVVVECQPELRELLATVPRVAKVVARGEGLPPFDAHLPLMSAPRVLEIEPSAVPARTPYLTAGEPPERVRTALAAASGRRIGLAWRGNPGHLEDWKRSLPFATLAPLLALGDITFVSLQVRRDEDAEPLPDGAIDAAPALETFADTAGVVAALDEVVSCDTAVAHLAGALAVPCRLLLPYVPDWRWGTAGDTTLWYPEMRLYRQPALRDWDSVVAAVTADLEEAG